MYFEVEKKNATQILFSKIVVYWFLQVECLIMILKKNIAEKKKFFTVMDDDFLTDGIICNRIFSFLFCTPVFINTSLKSDRIS